VLAQELTGKMDYPIVELPIRAGEKIHEVLVSEEEMHRAREEEDHYIVHPYLHFSEMVEQGKAEWFAKTADLTEYTSANTERLDDEGIVAILKRGGWL
jgi:UDP-glucose 4-epimerase